MGVDNNTQQQLRGAPTTNTHTHTHNTTGCGVCVCVNSCFNNNTKNLIDINYFSGYEPSRMI